MRRDFSIFGQVVDSMPQGVVSSYRKYSKHPDGPVLDDILDYGVAVALIAGGQDPSPRTYRLEKGQGECVVPETNPCNADGVICCY